MDYPAAADILDEDEDLFMEEDSAAPAQYRFSVSEVLPTSGDKLRRSSILSAATKTSYLSGRKKSVFEKQAQIATNELTRRLSTVVDTARGSRLNSNVVKVVNPQESTVSTLIRTSALFYLALFLERRTCQKGLINWLPSLK